MGRRPIVRLAAGVLLAGLVSGCGVGAPAGAAVVAGPLLGQAVAGQAVGQAVVGQAVVGQAVVGQAVVGQAVVGQASVGQASVDQAVVGQAVAGARLVTGAGEAPRRGPFRHFARGGYRWRVLPVTPERLGSSHRPGCPVPVADLRLLRLSHWGFDGRLRTGELVLHASQATAVVEVFRRLHAARVPVERMVTVEQYGSDDGRSMAANNTSAYNCRPTTGGTGFSEHAYGTALDLNPVQNPYVRGTTVLPDAGRSYLDRRDVRPGMVTTGDAVVRAFAAAGWGWGGDFSSLEDYQHFSLSGR